MYISSSINHSFPLSQVFWKSYASTGNWAHIWYNVVDIFDNESKNRQYFNLQSEKRNWVKYKQKCKVKQWILMEIKYIFDEFCCYSRLFNEFFFFYIPLQLTHRKLQFCSVSELIIPISSLISTEIVWY